jgi:hypothetical protein
MSGKLPDFQLGQLGLNIVASPLHLPDGSLTIAENVTFIRDKGIGGLGSRYGLGPISGMTALAGTVQALSNIPLTFPGDPSLMIALNSNTANSWRKSADGAAFTNLAAATLDRPEGFIIAGALGGVVNLSNFWLSQRPVGRGTLFYYAGDDYVAYNPPTLGSAPPLMAWNGTTAWEVFRIPTNPTSPADSFCYQITDMLMANNVIYMSVWDPGGGAVDHKGRVMIFDPENGTLQLVGNRFGDDTGENLAGYPMTIAWYLGQLWAGTNTQGGGTAPLIYRIQPGIDDTWTDDVAGAALGGGCVSLAVFNGNLYAGFATNDAGNAVVRQRTAAGTWTASLTVAGNPSYMGGLIVFDDELYVCHFHGGTACTIRKFDGSAWTTDKNVGTDINNTHAPGVPVVFQDALYWPFLAPTSDGGATGFLLKRTTGGVWSTV